MLVFICMVALMAAMLEGSVIRNPSKRFAALSVSGVGGTFGCVITGDKLFINGIFSRSLTGDELMELAQYMEDSTNYKKEVKLTLEEKRKELLQPKGSSKLTVASSETNFPEPPKKPSFCSPANTTQYYFGGCMVQNGKVYVGKEYARDLTAAEMKELNEFDEKMTAYQKYSSSIIQQLKDFDFFGTKSDILSLFSNFRSDAPRLTEASSATATASTTVKPVEVPEPPNFCITIY